MIRIDIKPLSVNEAWQGKRFKTPAYSKYESDVLSMLPGTLTVPDCPLDVYLEFGFSSSKSDLDNPVKLILDILQKQYKFNDKDIFGLTITKHLVAKGNEYFKFEINPIA